jgi:hypothetical protein
MTFPYQAFVGSSLWQAIDTELASLEANGDLSLSTPREYVIGALCARLIAAGLATSRPSDAQAP